MFKTLKIKTLSCFADSTLCKEIAQSRAENKTLRRQLHAVGGRALLRDALGRFAKRPTRKSLEV
ncbi:MAG: hypothetical protein OSB62_08980 [Alphaproteobacteria bacterium]|nr:hypothetical protein [Alphaproteobacteria bacterium]